MPVKITSGELRHKVVFKQPTSSLNDEAGIEKTFATAFETKAKVVEADIHGTTEASQSFQLNSFDFYIRYSIEASAVKKGWLVEYKAEDYTVNDARPINEDKKFIRINARVRTDG